MSAEAEAREPMTAIVGLLAIALGLGFLLICAAALWLAIWDDRTLSDNTVFTITAIAGGLVGILGSYVGFRHGFTAGYALAAKSDQFLVAPVPPEVVSPESPPDEPPEL